MLSKKADLEVQQRHYDKAASYFTQASEKYSEAIELTNSPDVSILQSYNFEEKKNVLMTKTFRQNELLKCLSRKAPPILTS